MTKGEAIRIVSRIVQAADGTRDYVVSREEAKAMAKVLSELKTADRYLKP